MRAVSIRQVSQMISDLEHAELVLIMFRIFQCV